MKTTLIILSVLIITSILLLYALGLMSRSGNAPGVADGRLERCSEKPNCVCSEYRDDMLHFIEPILLSKNNSQEPISLMKDIITAMGGNIQKEGPAYLAATYSSKIFGFVDDLEVRFDMNQNVVHLRSASRVGRGDRGVNKKRVELIKQHFNEKNIKDIIKIKQ